MQGEIPEENQWWAQAWHINNNLLNSRHLNNIWDNTLQPGEGQSVCEKSLFLRLPASQHERNMGGDQEDASHG